MNTETGEIIKLTAGSIKSQTGVSNKVVRITEQEEVFFKNVEELPGRANVLDYIRRHKIGPFGLREAAKKIQPEDLPISPAAAVQLLRPYRKRF